MSNLTYNDLQTPDGSNSAIKQALDDLSSGSGMGQISTAIFDTIYGINHRKTPNSVPINRDDYGLTFFTKPNLNLTTDNIRQVRQFYPLLTTEVNSMGRALRAMLDIDAASPPGNGKGSIDLSYDTPLVDPLQAFIPVLTNQLESISGWPDMTVQFFTTKPGPYGEEVSMVDSVVQIFRSYDIRANFRNIQGDPITNLFLFWIYYQSMVFQGILVPYMPNLITNTIDYNTRIYRLVLDSSRRFVQKIAACGAAFPYDTPIGNAFNFDTDGPLNRGNDKVTISFHCNGAMYNDPILIKEFNQTVGGANINMIGTDADRARTYHKLTAGEAQLFNHRGYPWIDPDTYELSWWVTLDEYNQLVNGQAADDNGAFAIRDTTP